MCRLAHTEWKSPPPLNDISFLSEPKMKFHLHRFQPPYAWTVTLKIKIFYVKNYYFYRKKLWNIVLNKISIFFWIKNDQNTIFNFSKKIGQKKREIETQLKHKGKNETLTLIPNDNFRMIHNAE